jgi:site-specific recombinase XerD
LRNIHRHCHFDERLRPTEANLKRARKQLVEIKQRIAAGTFVFAEEFPDYRFIKNVAAPQKRRACDQVFDEIRFSELAKIANTYQWSKKTFNNAISVVRCAFDYGYKDHPEKHNPASGLKCLRITKKDRPVVDPFTIQEAETLISRLHSDWGEAIGNYDEFRSSRACVPPSRLPCS